MDSVREGSQVTSETYANSGGSTSIDTRRRPATRERETLARLLLIYEVIPKLIANLLHDD